MSFPLNKLVFTESNRMASAVVAVALVAIGTAIYLSPVVTHHGHPKPDAATPPSHVHPGPTPSSSPRSAQRTASPKPRKSTKQPPGRLRVRVIRPPARTDVVVHRVWRPRSVNRTVPRPAKAKHCWDFKYQQDAQAAYLQNLSDPWGLDGKPGPHNGDGIACGQLPKDPSRPASTPADPFVPTAKNVPGKAQLLNPTRKFYGLSMDELPTNGPLFDKTDMAAGKAPNAVEWFDTWDHPYDGTGNKVVEAWTRGAFPVLTWMPEKQGGTSADQSQFTLQRIVDGKWDDYLHRWAAQVVKTGLPMGIRFAHEMNGNWYPWSADYSHPELGIRNTPQLYVQAWRHVWNVFGQAGANQDVIWIWSPVRINAITPGSNGYTTTAEDYPGDHYVDWVGTSAYQYKPSDGWSYHTTFDKTLNDLRTHGKPIFICETGATEAVGSTDYAAQKASWTAQALAGFLDDPAVVGFVWFNNVVDGIHKIDNESITTDWRFTSSPQAQAAFRKGVAEPRYGNGTRAIS